MNIALCIVGFSVGFYFSGNVVMSDGTGGAQRSADSAKILRVKDPVNAHLLRTAGSVSLPSEGPSLSRPKMMSDLDPATIAMLRALEPTARGRMRQSAIQPIPKPIFAGSVLQQDNLYQLHLASVAMQAEVPETIKDLKQKGGAFLDGVSFSSARVAQRDQSATFTRIYAGTFASQQDAQAACSALKNNGQYCAVLQFNP